MIFSKRERNIGAWSLIWLIERVIFLYVTWWAKILDVSPDPDFRRLAWRFLYSYTSSALWISVDVFPKAPLCRERRRTQWADPFQW